MSALFLSSTDVDKVISCFTPDDLVNLMAKVFARLSTPDVTSGLDSDISMPHRTVVPITSHNVLFMPSRLTPFGTTMKVVSVPNSSASEEIRKMGLPASTLVMNEQTGQLKAIVSAGKLTALRNAAGSLLSSRLLIPADTPPRNLVVVGSGAQIAAHISLFIQHYTSITSCTIFNRSINARMTTLLDSLRENATFSHVRFDGYPLPPAGAEDDTESPEQTVFRTSLESANIVVTATSSTSPLFPSSWVSPGTHLCLIGSYTPKMHEVDTDLVKRAGIIVVDSKEACRIEAGELIAAGVQDENMIEIGQLLVLDSSPNDQAPTWTPSQNHFDKVRNSGDVTIFKSVGVGLQDVAIASTVVDRAETDGLGTELRL